MKTKLKIFHHNPPGSHMRLLGVVCGKCGKDWSIDRCSFPELERLESRLAFAERMNERAREFVRVYVNPEGNTYIPTARMNEWLLDLERGSERIE